MMKTLAVLFWIIFYGTLGNAFALTQLKHENFDDKAIDSSMSVYGGWVSNVGYVQQTSPQYNLDQVGRSGKGFSFSSGTVNGVWLTWDKNLPAPWPSDEMYVSFWMRYPNFVRGTDTMENFKLFYPHWNAGNSYAHYTMSDDDTIYYSAKGNGAMLSLSNWLNCPNQADGNWHHYEFLIKFSTGKSQFWYDSVLKVDHTYGSDVWIPNTVSYIAAPMIDAEGAGTFSRQVDDWEVWDGKPALTAPAPTPNIENILIK